jgi:stage V sporulation protein S
MGTVGPRVFKVKSSTPAVELGSALAFAIEGGRRVDLRAIGAGAVNQAAKSIPIAQGYLASRGVTLITTISFADAQVVEDNRMISALVLHVEGITGFGIGSSAAEHTSRALAQRNTAALH